MKRIKFFYAVIGICIGTALGAILFLTLYSINNNPIFIPLIGVGTISGLILGEGIDINKFKKKNKSNTDALKEDD